MRFYIILVPLLGFSLACFFATIDQSLVSTELGDDYHFGIPVPSLDEQAQVEFESGRAIFNQSFTLFERGITSFNALSCTSCHNTPIAGGSGIYGNTFTIFHKDSVGKEVAFHRYSHTGDSIVERARPTFYTIRKTPPLFGMGVLEFLDDEYIFKHQDPDDENQDGISGRINWIENNGILEIGRFGWKATSSSLTDFVSNAYPDELGVDSRYLLNNDIAKVSAYLRYLSPPRNLLKPLNQESELKIFSTTGCGNCHLTFARTKSRYPVLNLLAIRPYTDMLLHDLTDGGESRHPVAGAAQESEFKTPSLWGLSFTGPPYMHDGSARSIEDAILLHNGEAVRSKNMFFQLSEQNRKSLLRWMNSL